MGFETKQFEEYREDDKPKKKEVIKVKNETIVSKEKPIDQQKFIENKFIRLDSIFKKEQSKVTNENNPTAPSVLDTKRGNITFHIEKDWGAGRNAEVTVKDGNDIYKILLEYPESSLRYQMSVFKESELGGKNMKKILVKVGQPMANNKATEYIGML